MDKINIGETVAEQFSSDLKLEMTALDRLKTAIKICFEATDHTSRELLEDILEDEEEHIDWLETQLGLLKELGKETYLAEQLKSS